ncbi:uncharacterized protein QC763_0101860 [Podospora pseudopauciseta]|uniref:Uncharacterized protein n=1 Tax=Podospora pseudopauciseta TaxID=2093780 RepID=A0ABR0GZU9_9PEZI|nr:hypothetical protein QC763_0101860 [Podospora pseudopauciseta]
MADHLAVLNMPIEALQRSHRHLSFEPFTLLSALSAVTERSASRPQPRLHTTNRTTLPAASPAWTTSPPAEQPEHRHDRQSGICQRILGWMSIWSILSGTSEPGFYEVVTGLWDSFADDAFDSQSQVRDLLDPSKLHVLNHKGESQSEGPLNIARPVQGWPVIVQAGQSEPGNSLPQRRQRWCFVRRGIFKVRRNCMRISREGQRKYGRNRDSLRILPAALVIVGDTVQDAKEKRLKLDSLVHYDSAIASLSIALGSDASRVRS